MTKFEPRKTYWCRSIGDHNCIWRITIARRTDKSIWTLEGKRLKIHHHDGVEMVYPHGQYSMAAQIKADHLEAANG